MKGKKNATFSNYKECKLHLVKRILQIANILKYFKFILTNITFNLNS